MLNCPHSAPLSSISESKMISHNTSTFAQVSNTKATTKVAVGMQDEDLFLSLKSMVSTSTFKSIDIVFDGSQDLEKTENYNLLICDAPTLNNFASSWNRPSKMPATILINNSGKADLSEDSPFLNVSDFLSKSELDSTSLLKSIQHALRVSELQEKLDNQTNYFEQFIENNGIPIFLVNTANFEIINVNQAAINQYGYSREEFAQLTILDIRPKDDIPALLSSFNQPDANTSEYKSQTRHITKEGDLIDVEVRSTPITINGISARLALVENVTEKLKADEIKRRNERRFQALVQEGMDIIAVISEDASHLYISPSVERILGFSQEEYMGMKIYDFLHPEDIPQIKRAFEILVKKREPVSIGPFRVKNAKGEWRYLESRFTNQLDDPAIMGLVSTSRDITSKVKYQMELQKSKERFENIAQLTNDLVYEYDPFSQQMTIITNGQHDIYDSNASTSQINRLDWEARMHPQDRDEMLQYLHQMFNGKHRLESVVEYRFQKPDGKYAHVQDSFKTIKGDNETFLIQGSIQDISLRKLHGALLSFEKDMLALYAKDQGGIETLLNKALKTLEDLIDGAMCSVLKLSPNKTIQHLCAPSLPKAYVDGINGLEIGPSVGSCGTAMYHGKTVIVTDIPNDPLWATHADFVSKFNLKACWSVPIRSQTGQVLGSFATYYHSCRKPDYFEMETISRAASVLGIILENFHAREDLKKLNQRYDIVALATSDLIWEYDPLAKKVMIDEVLFKKFGYLREDNHNELKWWINHLHKSERFKVIRNILTSLKEGQNEINQELFFRAANGEYRQLLTRIFIVKNEKGEVTRAIGAMEDITERESHVREIERQNTFLKEISWDQSHNVRAPLSRIMGLTELLASGEAKKEEFEQILNYLSESSQELDTIVRNIIRKVELMKRHSS